MISYELPKSTYKFACLGELACAKHVCKIKRKTFKKNVKEINVEERLGSGLLLYFKSYYDDRLQIHINDGYNRI